MTLCPNAKSLRFLSSSSFRTASRFAILRGPLPTQFVIHVRGVCQVHHRSDHAERMPVTLTPLPISRLFSYAQL